MFFMIIEYMGTQRGSGSFAAVFVSLPVLGLLFFTVPWEPDSGLESRAQHLQRLANPRASYLVDAIVNVEHVFAGGNSNWDGHFPWQEAERREVEIQDDVVRNGGATFLQEAIREGDANQLESILKKGADPNRSDGSGRTPLRSVVEKCTSEGARLDYEECLRHSGSCQSQQSTMISAKSSDVTIAALIHALISHGAKVDVRIPQKEILVDEHMERPQGDINLVEYARLRCATPVATAISKGKQGP